MIPSMQLLTQFIIISGILQNTLCKGYLLSHRPNLLVSAVSLRSNTLIMSASLSEAKTKRKREADTPLTHELSPKNSSSVVQIDEERLEEVIASATTLPTTLGGWKVADGLRHLVSVDHRFKALICKYGIPPFLKEKRTRGSFDPFHSLLQSIVYQQLATKAAESIHARVLAAYRNDDSSTVLVTPEDILNANVEVSVVDGKRKVLVNGVVSGLSEAKAKYVQSLAEHFLDEDKLMDKDFFAMPADELYRRLVAVKGLGPWSVDMFLIFHMHSPDVLPLGDLIVRKGLCNFLGQSEEYAKTEKKMQSVAESHCAAWAPYRTLASLYMWHMNDELKKEKKENSPQKKKRAKMEE